MHTSLSRTTHSTSPRAHTRAGFTLVETLVSIAILVTAVVGPMTIASRGLQSAYYAKEELTAVYLAQEAMELVRMHRDNYALSHLNAAVDPSLSGPDEWFSAMPDECRDADRWCGLDSLGNLASAQDCSVGDSCRLKFDASPTRTIYSYTTGVDSPFTRKIFLTGNDTETEVRVEVTWQSNFFGSTKDVTLRSHLFNAYDDY